MAVNDDDFGDVVGALDPMSAVKCRCDAMVVMMVPPKMRS